MLKNHRYGTALFIVLSIVVSLFPPVIERIWVSAGTASVSAAMGLKFLFDAVKGDAPNLAVYSVNSGLITLEYILAALCGAGIEIVLVFLRREEPSMKMDV